MDMIRLSPELLAYVTLRLRHAVSTGEYITAELLQQAIAAFQAQQEGVH